jgi:hypothetical protein
VVRAVEVLVVVVNREFILVAASSGAERGRTMGGWADQVNGCGWVLTGALTARAQ